MAEASKVLGQIVPAATTLTDLYTVPGATEAIISTLVVCNQNAAKVAFRVSIAPAGAADDPKHYIYFNTELLKQDSVFATIGITLAATDVVRVYSDTANVSFSLFGVEVT